MLILLVAACLPAALHPGGAVEADTPEATTSGTTAERDAGELPARIRQDTRDLLLRMDAALAPRCAERKVVGAGRGTVPPPGSSTAPGGASLSWSETWQVARCGATVPYEIAFAIASDGSIDVTARLAAAADRSAITPAADAPRSAAAPLPAASAPRPRLSTVGAAFLVTTTVDPGPGSLSQAILDANATPNRGGPDRIEFRIGGQGPHVIQPAAALPAITDPVILDGFSQLGARSSPEDNADEAVRPIVIDGSRLPRPAAGLLLRSGSSTVRGLVLRGFDGDGLRIEGPGANIVEGNRIGADDDAERPNTGSGIAIVDSADNVIGGDATARNVLAGNTGPGVRVAGRAAVRNAILGNAIAGNGGVGIELVVPESEASDEGPNRLMKAPILDAVTFEPAGPRGKAEMRVQGQLAADPGERYRVELFATSKGRGPRGAAAPAAGVPAQGERFLGFAEVATGVDGRAVFQFHLPAGIHARDLVTATATDASGNTSEFAAPLEAAALIVSWNTGSGNWSVLANWSPPQVPTATDDVVIADNGANTSFTVTMNVNASINSLTLGGGTGPQTLTVSGTILTLAAPSTVNANGVLNLAGTLTGAGSLTAAGPINWTAGTMSGSGGTTVNGTLTLSGTDLKDLDTRPLNTTSSTIWAGTGMMRVWGNAVITNSGTWESQSDATIFNLGFGGDGSFVNTGTFRKTIATGTTNFALPITNSGTVDVQTGILLFSMNGGSSTAAMTLASGATVQFSAVAFDLNAGHTFDGPGIVSIAGGTTNINAAIDIPAETTLNLQFGTLGGTGTLTTTGPFNWTGGTMNGPGATTVNGTFAISGAANKDLVTRTLNTPTALTTWTGAGSVRAWSNAVINNSGTWEAQSDATILNPGFGGAASFVNTGTFRKINGAGTTNFAVPITNSGTVDVRTGILLFSVGGSSSAAMSVAAGSTVQFSAGTFNLNAGHTFNDVGTFTIVGAALSVNAAIALPAATTLNLQSGTLGGARTLTTTGPFNWTGGTMNGPGATTVNGTFAINGAANKDLVTRTLNTPTALTTWTGAGSVRVWSNAVINNSGTWEAQSDATILNPGFGGAASFVNTGTFRKINGAGTTNFAVPITNSGTVDVQTGILLFSVGGSSSAAMSVAAGNTVQFGGVGIFNLNSGHTFNGPGAFTVVGTALSVNAAIALPAATTLNLQSGAITGTGTLTTVGPFNWTGGAMNGAGVTNANGTLAIGGPGTKDLTTRTLNTAGSTTWSGTGTIRIWGNAVINNSGTWDVQGDSFLFNPSVGTALLANTGTFRKSGTAGSTAISIPITTSGTVDLQSGSLTVSSSNYTQTGGTTKVNGGTLVSTTSVNIQGGTLSGSGTVTAPIVVSGTGATAPGLSPGVLNIAGNYTQQSPGGAFHVEIGGTAPGTQHDQVNVTGATSVATLGGTLNVNFANGFFPNNGDSFTILTYPSRTGTFTLNLPVLPCLEWQVTYGATALVLTVGVVPTEIANLMFAADNVTLSWDPGPPQTGTSYDLLRGILDGQPVGSGTGLTCLAQAMAGTTLTDATLPASGAGFWYLVREQVVGCGVGTYGRATNGTERIAAACP